MSLVFRQLHDQTSATYTYLLADRTANEAVLIDPVFEQARRDAALLRELGLRLAYTIDTHVHADHVTAAWLLKRSVGSRIALSAASGGRGMDVPLRDGDRIRFGARYLTALATPGHTNGCMTLVLDDRSMAFTGDALLIRGCGRTDFQQGSARELYRSIKQRIFTLPDECSIFPAHDYRGQTSSSVREEKSYNPRLGGERSEEDFVGFMANLGLPHPKQMDVAVPANLQCGHVEAAERALGPAWAPLRYTFSGVDEIDPEWVAENAARVQIIDVREPHEYRGELGHVPGARLVPLGDLARELPSFDKDKPIVTVCRSGGRSAQAVTILGKAGYTKAANLAGGMLSWRAHGLPLEI
jgi:glyoxylase-like metal-dependent hydrolase (beta-lactamase superfamily II)/rhodanese-related sulfurtransferase